MQWFDMKELFFILLITHCTFQIDYSQTGWVQQNSGTFCNLNSVCFVDASTGYAVGDSGSSKGVILKTLDGGSNWTRQLNSSFGLNSVFFVDAVTGFSCGNISGGHALYKTTNGGINWNYSGYSDQVIVYSVYFINPLTGFMAGMRPFVKLAEGAVLKTTDGGTNWSAQYLFFPAVYKSIFFTDALTGLVCGTSPLFKTTNTGVNWNQSAGFDGSSIYFINGLTGWMAGGDHVYKTTNGSSNWSLLFTQTFCIGINSVRFANEQTGWICGCLGTINSTTNGGTNWILQSSGTTTVLRSLSFVDAQTGWAAGDFGRILKTTTGGFTAVKPISNEIPGNFKLYQNYPNPFNPVTEIRFQIPLLRGVDGARSARRGVLLIIYDILGHEVTTLVNGQLGPGTYEVKWDGTNYPSGVYFYRLSDAEFTKTGRAILTK